MTLFNVRLGWWLPNPGYKGKLANFANAASEPRWALRPLLWEALSAIDEQKPYLYLSDGGHFDNLGLYETVRRGCRRIVVIDATADPDCVHNDLQDVMRKIRVDFGISIDFEPQALAKPQRCVLGTIEYRNGPPGCLYYIKPTLCGDEPLDLLRYAAETRVRSPKSAFPHQSTGDQFFNEAQFESYRLLGFHTITTLWGIDKDECAVKWPTKATLEEYAAKVAAYAKADAGSKGGDKVAPVSSGAGTTPGAGGVVSGIAQTAQSMSQGALLATALGVGGAIGVGGYVVMQDSKTQVEISTPVVPSPGTVPTISVEVVPPGPRVVPDPTPDVPPRVVFVVPPGEPRGEPRRKGDRGRAADPPSQTVVNVEAEFQALAKLLGDIRAELKSTTGELKKTIDNVPATVGAADKGNADVSGSRLQDIQTRLGRVETALSQVRATR
jgi:hypothetical protein